MTYFVSVIYVANLICFDIIGTRTRLEAVDVMRDVSLPYNLKGTQGP